MTAGSELPSSNRRETLKKVNAPTDGSIETRFQKGKSGNPYGRPRKPGTPAGYMGAELERKVSVTMDGKKKRVAALQAIFMRLTGDALRGDRKAAAELRNYISIVGYHPDPIDMMKWYRQNRDDIPPDQRRNLDKLLALLNIEAALIELGLIAEDENKQPYVNKLVLDRLFEDDDTDVFRNRVYEMLKLYWIEPP